MKTACLQARIPLAASKICRGFHFDESAPEVFYRVKNEDVELFVDKLNNIQNHENAFYGVIIRPIDDHDSWVIEG